MYILLLSKKSEGIGIWKDKSSKYCETKFDNFKSQSLDCYLRTSTRLMTRLCHWMLQNLPHRDTGGSLNSSAVSAEILTDTGHVVGFLCLSFATHGGVWVAKMFSLRQTFLKSVWELL